MLSLAIPTTPHVTGVLSRFVRYVRSRLPEGRALPRDVWERQHRAILVLIWLHAIGIVCYGLIAASSMPHTILEGGLMALAALLAGVIKGSRRLRAGLATFGLLTASAVLVHLSGGFVEMHFHFLMMMVIIALYQDWVPFLLAIGYIISEYTVVGLLEPTEFFGRTGSGVAPWQWLLIHVAFVLAACIAGLVHWRLDESAHARAEQEQGRRVHEEVARAEAEQAIRARDDLMSVVSHDLKDPLGAMKGYAQLTQRRLAQPASTDSARTLEGLEKIDTTATKMTAQIDDLLDVVRREMGEGLALIRRPVDLVALVGRVVDEYQRTTEHHRMFVAASAPTLVGCWDENRLERALGNLLANAIKYSPDGEIAVGVAREDAADQSWAIVSVRDQGVGIPTADLPFIFDRFHRNGRKVGNRIEGRGVGLPSARLMVEQHRGTISVESTEGVGSTFTIRLPLRSE